MIADMQAAFLDDIIAHPDDDTPRLIFADWLDDNGEPERAEFIRVQIKLARLQAQPDRPTDPMMLLGWLTAMHREHRVMAAVLGDKSPCECEQCLCAREGELLGLAMKPQLAAFAWSQPIHSAGIGLGRVWTDIFTFRRGFVAEVCCTLADWYTRKHGPAIAKAHPLERVTLTGRKPATGMHGCGNPGNHAWASDRQTDAVLEFVLPHAIYRLLPRHRPRLRAAWNAYPSAKLAIDALSAACIEWARLPAEQRGM